MPDQFGTACLLRPAASIKHHHLPHRLARVQAVEALVDVVEPEPCRLHLFE